MYNFIPHIDNGKESSHPYIGTDGSIKIGFTKREHLSALFMQALISSRQNEDRHILSVAEEAIQLADALLYKLEYQKDTYPNPPSDDISE